MGLFPFTAALMRRFPGMLMGSGATERLWSTTGSFPSPQFSQEKPPTCSTGGEKSQIPGLPCPGSAGGFPRAGPPTRLLTDRQKMPFSPLKKPNPPSPSSLRPPTPQASGHFRISPSESNYNPPFRARFPQNPVPRLMSPTPARSAWKCLACKRAENHFSHRFQHRRAKVVKGKVRGSGVGWRWPELLGAQTALGLGQLPALPWEIGSRFALQTRWNISPVPGARERQTSLTHQPPCSFPLLQTPRGAGAEPAGGPGLGKRLEEPGEQFALLG